MQKIKVIIGASYGDEGKGLATDFFGAQGKEKNGTINVLTNGGPQRGHTVELPDGRRHVFKHFGAATFRGAVTYFAEQFLVNPMEFLREYDELCALHKAPEAYMHPGCRFTTPWDMLTNQMLREMQGLHNSCGFGIWETVLRCRRGFGIPFSAFTSMSHEDRISWLRSLRDGYFVSRLKEVGATDSKSNDGLKSNGCLKSNDDLRALVFKSDGGLRDLFFSDDLLHHFAEDCETMRFLCPVRGDDYLRSYQTVLFENAQGLLLDGNAPEETDFTTPSTTGVGRVFQTVEKVFQNTPVEVCYITRSYLTRHGDGSMENELSSKELAKQLPGVGPDVTNVRNRCQGTLRYGMLDIDLLTERIRQDFAQCKSAAGNLYLPSVMVTHLNEYAGIDTDCLRQRFGTIYLSDGRTGQDVSPSFLQVTK